MRKFMMIVVMVAALVLPTMAQQQEWQSTSTMQGTGSSLAPQVTAVGASSVGDMATTTSSYSPAKASSGPRRGFDLGGDTKPSEQSPIGDAVLPMLLCAAVFCGVIALRRKRSALKS